MKYQGKRDSFLRRLLKRTLEKRLTARICCLAIGLCLIGQTILARSRFAYEPGQIISGSTPFYQVRTALSSQENLSSLETGKAFEQTLAGGESHTYRVSLKAGEYLKVIVNQRGIDVNLRLYNSDGAMLVETDSLNAAQGLEAVSAMAERAATFRIEVVSPIKGVMAGRYQIRIDAMRPATEQDKKWLDAQSAYAEGLQLLGKSTEQSRHSAIANFEKASSCWAEAGDNIKQAHALAYIGQAYDYLGQSQKSFDYYNQALQVIRQVGDSYEEANIKLSLGLAYNNIGKPQMALECGLSALALWQAIKEPTNEGLALRLIGFSYRLMGQPRKALEYFNQALSVFGRVKDLGKQASVLRYMAQAYDFIDETQKAMECLNKALAIYQAIGNRYWQAETLRNIGRIYSNLGDSFKALEYLNRALSSYQVIGDQRNQAITIGFIGDAHAQMNDYKTALEYYDKALNLIAGSGDRRYEAGIIRMIGDAYAATNDARRALEYYERALEAFKLTEYKPGEAVTISRIGNAYLSLGDPQKAIGHFKNALDMLQIIEDHQSKAFALYGIGRAERKLGNLDRARAHLEAALSEVEIIRARNKDQQQLTSFLASTQRYSDEYISLLMQLHKSRPAEGFDALAIQASEQARARGLAEMLTETRVDFREGVAAELIEQERNLFEQIKEKADQQFDLFGQKGKQEQLAALSSEISELESRLQQVKATIRAKSPRYAALTQPRPLTVKEIQHQVLDRDSLLLEYSLGADHSFLWAVSREGVKSYELPRRDEIEKAARDLRSLLTARSVSISGETLAERRRRIALSESKLANAAARLSQMILGPAASELGSKRLIVVADGGLQYIPFAALPLPAAQASLVISRSSLVDRKANDKGQMTNDKYRPLIVEHEIITLPSASVLAVLREGTAGRKTAPKGVAVFADPVFAGSDARLKTKPEKLSAQKKQPQALGETRILDHISESSSALTGRRFIPRLPFTRQEAKQILALAAGMTNLEATDFKANRQLATSEELSQYRYVHFATHGYLDSEHPEQSGLLMSLVDEQGKPQNGLLRAGEIYNLSLPAELVVMSACQTGLGKQWRGEGVLSLTQPFMYAGAARVVMSLWNVSDRASSDLMQRFYRGMLKEGQRPAEALRSAQLEMFKQKQWQSPYYWAAFTLQGEWQ